MNIHIITYAYTLSDVMLESFAAADGPNITWHLFRHGNRPLVTAACEQFAARPNVVYYPYGTDRGLARSCNEGLIAAAGADVVIQMCDDILSGPGDIQRLAEAVLDHPDCSHVTGNTFVERVGRWEPGSFDVCAINLKAVERIGYFDVNCWPLNFEDVDWMRRAELSGMQPVILPDTQFLHRVANPPHEGSEFQSHFVRTRDYYERKWNGDWGHESFTVPFNDARYDLTIPRERIDNPYPDYNREDIAV